MPSRHPYTDEECGGDGDEGDKPTLLQSEPRSITQEQLVNEVTGIYADLVMVEKKCIEVCNDRAESADKPKDDQWQALIALHRTTLHEHHDFFLSAHHPTASAALRRLDGKYAMPARMWRHGIHAFLELLRHRLPESLDHMSSFVYIAYSMMSLLMGSVPSFAHTWIECLGDLARYRMAMEETDLRDRKIWSNVARMWYQKAADRSPNVGRIQHHLAVLARPNIVQQLFCYSKTLVAVTPLTNAHDSIMLLFNPFSNESDPGFHGTLLESKLVQGSATMFLPGPFTALSEQEHYTIGELDWVSYYHLIIAGMHEDERILELPRHIAPRAERCLWLGARLLSLQAHMSRPSRRRAKQCLEAALSHPRAITNLHCDDSRPGVALPHNSSENNLSANSALAMLAGLTTIIGYLARTPSVEASRGLAESLFKVLESLIAWTTSSLPYLVPAFYGRKPVYSTLALVTILPKATASPVGGTDAKGSDGLAQFLLRMLEQAILWIPPSVLCLAPVLYCRNQLPFLPNTNAISNPRRTHGIMSFAWDMALLVVGGPDLAAQIHYPMRLASVSELCQYGQAVFPELRDNFDFRPVALVLLGSLTFDASICFLMSPSQGIDPEVFMQLLHLSVWLTLTLASGRNHVVAWTRRRIRSLGEGAVALAGNTQV